MTGGGLTPSVGTRRRRRPGLWSPASRRVEIVNNSPTQPVLRVVPEYAVTGREDGLRGVVSPTEIVPRDVLGPGEMWSVPVMYLADDGSVGATDDYYWSQHDHDHLHRRRWASLEAGEQQRAREKARRAVVTVPPPLRPPGAARRPPRHEVGRHVVQQLHTLAVGGLQRVGARSQEPVDAGATPWTTCAGCPSPWSTRTPGKPAATRLSGAGDGCYPG